MREIFAFYNEYQNYRFFISGNWNFETSLELKCKESEMRSWKPKNKVMFTELKTPQEQKIACPKYH